MSFWDGLFSEGYCFRECKFHGPPNGNPHQRSRRLAYEPLGFPFTDHFTKGFNDKNYLAFMGIISSVAACYKDPDVHLPGFDFVHMFYWFFGWVSTHSSRHLFSTNIVATFLRTHLPNIPRNPLISANIGAFSGGKHWRWHPWEATDSCIKCWRLLV